MAFADIAGIPTWQNEIYAAELLAFVVLLVRVVSLRLARSYPALTTWLAFNILTSAVFWIVRMGDAPYHWYFVFDESSFILLYCWMVLTLYANVLRDLPGLASLARRVIQVVLPVSAIGSLSLLAFERAPGGPVTSVYVVGRALITALALFVLMITAFIAWFPVRVSRNTIVYSIGFTVYLVSFSASQFLQNSGHGVPWLGGVVAMIACTACLLFWAVGLSRAGETSNVALANAFHPQEEARLLAQLQAINRTLSGTNRR